MNFSSLLQLTKNGREKLLLLKGFGYDAFEYIAFALSEAGEKKKLTIKPLRAVTK